MKLTCPKCKRTSEAPAGSSITCACGREAKWVTEEQAAALRAYLETEHGESILADVRVGEDGSTTEVETWGDRTTTTRRTPLPDGG